MIGHAVRVVRENLGMEGKELAQILNISPSYLSRIETNKRNASAAILSSIDQVAAEHGHPTNLVGLADVNDPTARLVHGFMSRPDVSALRKDSVRRLVESLLRME